MFKQKYIKYKTKYSLLKSQHNTQYITIPLVQRGGIKKLFEVQENSGKIIHNNIKYSNQCIWISIIEYLVQQGMEINIDDIRKAASNNGEYAINDICEIFDTEIYGNALVRVCEKYKICIHIYTVFYSDNDEKGHIDTDFKLVYGNMSYPHHIDIASYGNHFELITEMFNYNENDIEEKDENYINEEFLLYDELPKEEEKNINNGKHANNSSIFICYSL